MSASFFVPLVGITLMAIGLAGVAAAAWRSHKTSSRLDFIRSLGSEAELYVEPAPAIERVQDPPGQPDLRSRCSGRSEHPGASLSVE